MKLKVNMAKRDRDGEIVSTEPIDSIPVWKNRGEKTTESADIDTIRISGLIVNPKGLFVKIFFQVGAVNSDDVFAPAPDFKEIEWTITPGSQRLWAKYIEGRRVFDFDEIEKWLHDENIVVSAGRDNWNLPDLETELIQA